jgi:hypothetical protein
MAHDSLQWRLQLKRINSRGLLLAVFLLGFMDSTFAQTQAKQDAPPTQPPTVTAPSAVGVGATADLSLVGTLEGRRTWLGANGKERSGGAKLEQVKIENGKGTALFTGNAGIGNAGSCGSVFNLPAELTLDSSGVLTIIAKTESCGTWEYTLQRVSPTLFKGRHRVNPTEIVLEFKPG